MEITVDCIEADVPTKNGRIYSLEQMEKASRLFNEKIIAESVYILSSYPEDRDIRNVFAEDNNILRIVGKVKNCKIVYNRMVIDAKLIGYNSLEEFTRHKYGVSSKILDVVPLVFISQEKPKVIIEAVDSFRIIQKNEV